MGHACPVCGDPQVDAEHLANHVAFTAILGDADHETWLDEHVPDWDQRDPESLAPRVADHAESIEFPQVFEDTTDGAHDHAHDHSERSGALFDDDPNVSPVGRRGAGADGALDPEAERILSDAREMTRRNADGADADADDGDGDGG